MSNQHRDGDDDHHGGGESISSTQSMILDLPPSCVEFCPARPSYFLVGTYNLQKEEPDQEQEGQEQEEQDGDPLEAKAKQPQSRNGSIIVFRLRHGKAYPVQTLPQPSAVFDLHFQPHEGRGHICATVSSTGTISFFTLTVPATTTTDPEETEETLSLTQLSVLRLPKRKDDHDHDHDHDDHDDVLFTFFAWHPTIAGLMAITTATGAVVLVRVHQDYQGLDVLEASLMEHDGLEAWCVAFGCQPGQPPPSSSLPFTVFSGGDDSKLRYTLYDYADTDADADTAVPVLATTSEKEQKEDYDDDDDEEEDNTAVANNRIPYPPVSLGNHEAGVTFILPLPLPLQQQPLSPTPTPDGSSSYLVATGSYDEHLRVWAVAPLDRTGGARRATCLADERLGGGVWRLNILDTTVTPTVTPTVTTTTSSSSSSNTSNSNSNSNSNSGGSTTRWEILLLASCMHAGSRIVRIKGGGEAGEAEAQVEIEVLARFEEHKSMNYGSDWFRGGDTEGAAFGSGGGGGGGEEERGWLCVSTSFYDRLLCVWRYK